MKICVLTPSEDYLKRAGVRIRYRRLENHLRDQGHNLDIIPIHNLTSKVKFVHDIYLISKCNDARALIISALLQSQQKTVGVDLFDDYFSHNYDPRFQSLQLWLNSLIPWIDFILCSTPAMSSVAKQVAPNKPVHVLNDPFPGIDEIILKKSLNEKLEQFTKNNLLKISWFGIGDNPHFPVGLKDLVNFSGELAALRGHGFEVQLDILTNLRALTANSLAALRRISIPYSIDEWTEEKEAALLTKSMVCFLPVNAQKFSIVKSLNRAVSALSYGAQVLSCGYPLYDNLSPFIYNDSKQLVQALINNQLSLREDTIPQLMSIMKQWASAENESNKITEFLIHLIQNKTISKITNPVFAVIHGKNSSAKVHKFAQMLGALSVASPFYNEKLNYNIRFSLQSEGLVINIEESFCTLLNNNLKALLGEKENHLDQIFYKINYASLFPEDNSYKAELLNFKKNSIYTVSNYKNLMADCVKVMKLLFPGIIYFYSEQCKTPLWISPLTTHSMEGSL